MWSQTVDGGRSFYAYSTDGKLRYTQNAKQKVTGKFSYTNYDRVGRVIEVGEYIPPYYNSIPPSPGTAYYFPGDPMRNIININQAVYVNVDANFVAATPTSEIASASYTAYDEAVSGSGRTQKFTIGKVSKVWNENGITWYSYNAEGELTWDAQSIDGLHDGIITNYDDIKYTDYTYDLIGNVTKVEYQKDAAGEDKFTHFYSYDFDGRITRVQTEDAFANKKTQAEYTYYQDGSVKEVDMAEGLQTLKYRYTIHGWLKSINGDALDNTTTTSNSVFSMSLEYYQGDYLPADGIVKVYNGNRENGTTNIDRNHSFTGNIVGWRWRNSQTGNSNFDGLYGYNFDYNERNELSNATFGGILNNTGSFKIDLTNDYKVSGINYDNNGNITSLNRSLDVTTNGISANIDVLQYHYYSGTNKLSHIQDQTIWAATNGDIGNQATNNYTYSEIGELTQDNSEDNKIIYDVYGKVTQVTTVSGTIKAKYFYDGGGQRVKKETYNATTVKTTWYIAGHIYERTGTSGELLHTEITISGGGRLGVAYTNTANNSLDYNYELSDHLGNVRAVIRKAAPGSTNPIDILSYADYFPFGWQMPGRNQQGDYRYAYQGQEKDPETGWEAFELRMYDGRVGRWMTMDLYDEFYSPYLAMSNDPINKVDSDGGRTEDFAILLDPKAAGGHGHMASIIQDENGKYYYVSMGPTGNAGNLAMISNSVNGGMKIVELEGVTSMKDAIKATNEIRITENGIKTIYTENLIYNTNSNSDKLLYAEINKTQSSVNDGEQVYNPLTNNCSDAILDAVQKVFEAAPTRPNYKIRPNVVFENLETRHSELQQIIWYQEGSVEIIIPTQPLDNYIPEIIPVMPTPAENDSH